ncbi:MAG: acyl-CoA dehydrogenase family protein [Candidatus Schekmanbacteria bacterium]|nr:acyl-CoA dehydrogenase family protein [Candidatus Schekmanbacteria bacterium]
MSELKLDFELTEDQKSILQTVKKICKDIIIPRAEEIDKEGKYPWDVKEVFAREGLLALPIPIEYDGLGADLLTVCMVLTEIAKADMSCAMILATNCLAIFPMFHMANDEQKKKYFPRIAAGEILGAVAMSEPEAGSDLANLKARAVKDGDYYVITGEKRWITNAGVADFYSFFARTSDEAKKAKGISTFIVEKDQPGFSLGRKEDKLGARGSVTGDIVLDGYRCHKSMMMGPEGEGFVTAMKSLNMERPVAASMAMGVAEGAYEYARDYAKQRVQFGRPIADFQAIQFMLADMKMQIEASKLLLYTACIKAWNHTPDATLYSSMCKTFVSDTAMKVTVDAVQILGGYGCTREYPVERMMRDAKITQIFAGTNQIQRIVIAREILKD